ncbi:MAG: 50S ribosomal protein L30 [Chitinophagales bacterium]
MAKMFKITLKKSLIGHPERQRATIKSLGLRKLNQTVIREESPELKGMLAKVSHLVTIEEA